MHRQLLRVSALVMLLMPGAAGAQLTYSSGQSVSPAFEGWWQNDDGTYTLFFGYMNDNWAEELDVPIGPDNRIEPGGPDQDNRPISCHAETCFCFRCRCRQTSVTRSWSGR